MYSAIYCHLSVVNGGFVHRYRYKRRLSRREPPRYHSARSEESRPGLWACRTLPDDMLLRVYGISVTV
jgi:hypothetical protein